MPPQPPPREVLRPLRLVLQERLLPLRLQPPRQRCRKPTLPRILQQTLHKVRFQKQLLRSPRLRLELPLQWAPPRRSEPPQQWEPPRRSEPPRRWEPPQLQEPPQQQEPPRLQEPPQQQEPPRR